MKTISRLALAALPILVLSFAALSAPARAAEENQFAKLDWSPAKDIPVYYEGRVMPLDTFARSLVKSICGRENPELDMAGMLGKDEVMFTKDGKLDEGFKKKYARQLALFPDGKPRRFEAVELLFSWMLEPEAWYDIPFLHCEYEPLRAELLGLPIVAESGERLKYVSPSQLDSDKFRAQLEATLGSAPMMDDPEAAKEKKQETPLEEKTKELWNEAQAWKYILFSSHVDRQNIGEFEQVLGELVSGYEEMKPWLTRLGQTPDAPAPLKLLDSEVRNVMDAVSEQMKTHNYPLNETTELLRHVRGMADLTYQVMLKLRREMVGAISTEIDALPEGEREAKKKQYAAKLQEFDSMVLAALEWKENSDLALRQLWENRRWLRVVPALDIEALEQERDPESHAHPWLDLQTILYGPHDLFVEQLDKEEKPAETNPHAESMRYPREEWSNVWKNFSLLRDVYVTRNAAGWPSVVSELRKLPLGAQRDDVNWQKREEAFPVVLGLFADSLRDLAVSIEPRRQALPFKERDEKQLAYTAYPTPERMKLETRYNRVQPFLGSWILFGIALGAFGLSFGVMRRWMFWLGMAMMAAAIAWTIYAFSMRVRITGWAPVTNMYETVIWVPLVAAVLGAWFALVPMIWRGIQAGWRLSAFPGTWEATPLTEIDKRALSPQAWTFASFAFVAVRVALMTGIFMLLTQIKYGYPARALFSLTPRVDIGKSLPDANDLLVWLIAMAIMFSSMWWLPRAVLALMAAVPLSLTANRGAWGELVEQTVQRKPFVLATAAIGCLMMILAWWVPTVATEVLDDSFKPLQPILRDNVWLTIHVLTIVSSYAAGALAFGLGMIGLWYYLFGSYTMSTGSVAARNFRDAGFAPAKGDVEDASPAQDSDVIVSPPPQTAALAQYVYRAMQVAVILLGAGTILGGIWADESWGRFWGWDPKEVWALISFLVYIGILHARFAGMLNHFGLMLGAVIGCSAIAMSWYGVNFVLPIFNDGKAVGLHSYGSGTGGIWYVGGGVVFSWFFAAAAGFRYFGATSVNPPASEESEPTSGAVERSSTSRDPVATG